MRWFLGMLLAMALVGCESKPSLIGFWKPDKDSEDPSTYLIRKDGTFELDGEPSSSSKAIEPQLKDISKMSGTWNSEGDRLTLTITRSQMAKVFEEMGKATDTGTKGLLHASDGGKAEAAYKPNADLDKPIKAYYILHFRDKDTLVLTTDDYKRTTVFNRQKQAD